jgi:GDP-4-dehydro-6-deoxy-D-mannose reductase
MSKRVLITGANGFVGGHLCGHLAEHDYEVVCGIAGAHTLPCPTKDFSLSETASIESLVEWAGNVDYVVHLAAIAFVPDAAKSPAGVLDVNLIGTVRLIDALQRHAPKARVLYIGSGEAYGKPEALPLTEEHPLNPANPYAISKAAADHYCAYAAKAAGAPIIRARPFNHSGPGQADAFALPSFARQIAEMELGKRSPQLKVGNLQAVRDFTHVSDVVRAYRLLLERGRVGEAYNICSGKGHSIQSVLDGLIRLAKTPVEVRVDPERLRPSDVPEVRGSCAKLTADTGWTPVIPIDWIVRDVLNDWRQRCRA